VCFFFCFVSYLLVYCSLLFLYSCILLFCYSCILVFLYSCILLFCYSCILLFCYSVILLFLSVILVFCYSCLLFVWPALLVVSVLLHDENLVVFVSEYRISKFLRQNDGQIWRANYKIISRYRYLILMIHYDKIGAVSI
jgi:hypothetical protein